MENFQRKNTLKEAADGSRTHVSSLEGWGNSRYTTAAFQNLPNGGRFYIYHGFTIIAIR